MIQETAERVLKAAWGTRSGYVFLPFKEQPSQWHETPGIPYPGKIEDELPAGKVDQYFCPIVFSQPHRKKEFALSTNLLWADLDPIHPDSCRVKPSIAWESSPGRYQALWFLTTEVSAEEASSLSKRIAYADGGDKGGWDVTQVLRLPGTRNYKYASTPEVKLMWAKRAAYSTSEIMSAYPPVNGEVAHEAAFELLDSGTVNSAIATLPVGLRKRLVTDTTGADRSKELQLLTRDLLRFGLSPDIVYNLIKRSTWNKFRGRSDELAQLAKQVTSALVAVAERKEKSKPAITPAEPLERMQVHQWGDFLQIPTKLRWLVDEAWVDGSVGFISGRSKSYKTWIALDLALSIVSGAPFLGRYPTRRVGPVILVQEEDPTAVLQERLRLISKTKGLLPVATISEQNIHIEYPEFPLHIINLQGFNLGVEDKVAQIRQLIAEVNPVLVILDPLIVLLPQGVDEYKGVEVSAVLQSIKMWREEFGCAVAIVHHWNKSKNDVTERFAEHMYGSFAFHAWLESAIHVMPVIEEDQEQINQIVVEREFKAAPSGRSMKLQFNIDTKKEYTYEVQFLDDKNVGTFEQLILDHIGAAGPQTTPELVASTGHARPKVVEACGRLVRANMLKANKGGGRGKSTVYWLPDQVPPQNI